jgi:hypothetical protein
MVESLFELRELAEDNLLANPAGAAPDAAALRGPTARQRLVELVTKNANRMQVAARDGFQLAAKVFGGQPDSYMGLTVDEMAAIRQARKETEAAKKKEETAVAASTKQPVRYIRNAGMEQPSRANHGPDDASTAAHDAAGDGGRTAAHAAADGHAGNAGGASTGHHGAGGHGPGGHATDDAGYDGRHDANGLRILAAAGQVQGK